MLKNTPGPATGAWSFLRTANAVCVLRSPTMTWGQAVENTSERTPETGINDKCRDEREHYEENQPGDWSYTCSIVFYPIVDA